ncbi:hypothetical protein ACWGII_14500 [Streptomyces sp. NPDC054855]
MQQAEAMPRLHPHASFFNSALPFGMICGGHIDTAIRACPFFRERWRSRSLPVRSWGRLFRGRLGGAVRRHVFRAADRLDQALPLRFQRFAMAGRRLVSPALRGAIAVLLRM